MLDSCRPRIALVEQPRRACQITMRQVCKSISLSGQHEADPLVLAQGLAEGGAAPRIIGGDVVRPPGRAKPAHAMRQARRREPRLSVAEPLPHLAEHRGLRHPQPVEPDHRMAAGHVLVEGIEHPLDVNARRVHRREEHRGAGRTERIILGYAP